MEDRNKWGKERGLEQIRRESGAKGGDSWAVAGNIVKLSETCICWGDGRLTYWFGLSFETWDTKSGQTSKDSKVSAGFDNMEVIGVWISLLGLP